MSISTNQLLQIMPNARKKADEFIDYINSAMTEFEINTALRQAAFLAQIAVETGELNYFIENLNYSVKGLLETFPKYFDVPTARLYMRSPERIANRVYANRMGNGTESSGDGWNYRGRGVGLTGRSNYRLFGGMLGIKLVEQPELAAQPEHAFRIFATFWKMKGCNLHADLGQFEQITRTINGGLNGQPERLKFYGLACHVLCVDHSKYAAD